MPSWKWEVVEDDFGVKATEGTAGVGGPARYFIKYKDEPYKAKIVNEKSGAVIYLSLFSNPDLVKPPGMFNLEYRTADYYTLDSFCDPEDVEKWLYEKGVERNIENRTDLHYLHILMKGFTKQILETTQRHGFGISHWAKEWLESLENKI